MNCKCCEWGIVIDGCKELMANFQDVDFLLKRLGRGEIHKSGYAIQILHDPQIDYFIFKYMRNHKYKKNHVNMNVNEFVRAVPA